MQDTGKRRWWHRYIPAGIGNPFGLSYRLLTNRNPAARSAVLMAAAGITAAPIDWMLQRREKVFYDSAPRHQLPVIIVVGPPRSGTTLVAQYLINTFNVCYLNNLTSLFPRSPLVANRLFGHLVPLADGSYEAFYGKSRGLCGANDALHIWDRWLGADRQAVPTCLSEHASIQMPKFFGALQALYGGRPVINKVNRLNTCAHLVSAVLENSYFICLHRDPTFLAQSLYLARSAISGRMDVPYGTKHSDRLASDPIEDVCRQVLFHEELARRQQLLLGAERFAVVSYEAFCERPADFAVWIKKAHPTLSFDDGWPPNPTPFRISRDRKLPEDVLDRMAGVLANLGAGEVDVTRF